MYINFNQDKQCGQCSALNQYESVWRGNEYLIRCINCGHEKVISKLTTTFPTNTPIIYNSGNLSTKEIF